MPHSSARFILSCALAAALLSGCGGGGGGDATEPRPSPTRSVDLPSPTRTSTPSGDAEPSLPERTREPGGGETTTAEPTRQPEEPSGPGDGGETRPPAAAPSTATVTRTTERTQPTQSTQSTESTQTTETTESTQTTETTASADEGDETPAWVWWLLAALVAAVVIGATVAVIHSRRRRRWLEDCNEAEDELVWFARVLLPELRSSASLDEVVGAWRIASSRVSAAEDRLTVLEASAPSDADRLRAQTLRDAARRAQQRLDSLTVVAPHDTWALDLDEVAADLQVALGATTPPPGAPG